MTTQCSVRQKTDDNVDAAAVTGSRGSSTSLIDSHLPVIFQHLPAGVVVLDKCGTIIGYNPAAVDLLSEPLFAQSWWAVIQRAFQQVGEHANDLILHDGRVVNCQTCPMGNVPGQIILLNEITQVRALEGRIKRYQQLTFSGELAARLAHQIRTPLAAALLYCDQLIEVNLPKDKRVQFAKKMKQRLGNIESHVKDMLLLVNVPRLQDFNTMTTTQFSRELQHQLEKQFPDTQIINHSQGCIRVHFSSLLGAITNCLHNALAAQANQTQLELTNHSNQLQLSIKDNGAGMPDSIREQACQPFFTTKKQGTGLGLAVAQSVVTAHEGTLTIDTHKGNGTTIRFMLPLVES